MLDPGHAGGRGIELFLLRGHPENERRHCHCSAIHRAGMGTALCGRARPAKVDSAEGSRGGGGNCGNRLDDRDRGGAIGIPAPLGCLGPNRRHACLFFVCLLQRWRTPHSRAPRPLAGSRLDPGVCLGLLAIGQPAVEGGGSWLHLRAVGIPVHLFDDLSPGIVLSLFSGSAAPGALACHYRELSGTGILNPVGGSAARRRCAPYPGARNRAGALGDRDRAVPVPGKSAMERQSVVIDPME